LAELPLVTVNKRAESRLQSGHVWIYSSDVVSRGDAQPGDTVRVANERKRILGIAHYSASSQITLRLLSREAASIGREFWLQRLRAAAAHRERVVSGSDAYRLIHAEGDQFPGLIVDRYGSYLVAQFLDQGMDRAQPEIVSCLGEIVQPAGILARNDVPARKLEQLPTEPAVLMGEIPDRVEVSMNGLHWFADLRGGQKTGVFLDQRENYAAAARFARGRALDCFTCSGGFALHMAARCEQVEGVDSSASSLALAEANRDANALANVSFREANVFDILSNYLHGGRRFDTIVLDPPAFAKTKSTMDAAQRGYRDINYKAMRLIERGGTLVTCSCSYHVSESDLLSTVAAAALDAGRTLRVLERRTQAADHPILLTVPETMYLKCIILEVL
jgi:23S rRNA (cytosine1962-C5)-methyltransferase